MRRLFIISIILSFLSNFSTIGQVDIQNIKNQTYLKYKDNVNCDSAITTLELRICANIDFQQSDSILSDIYNAVLLKFEKLQLNGIIEIFKNSQKEWIEYRDKHCEVYWIMYDGGTLQPVIYLNCLTDLTNDRQKELKELLDEINQ